MTITTDSPIYQKAFEQYLRRGTPIEVSLKMLTERTETRDNHSTVLYRWHTAGDDKVRPSHAVNEGRIFNWDIAPATGHPGEEPGCRCRAEPYVQEFLPDDPTIDDPPIEPVYPEAIIPLLRIPRLIIAWRAWALNRRTSREWQLSKTKTREKWTNQLEKSDWTPNKITQTIKNGTPYKAVNKTVTPNREATIYKLGDDFVVVDNKTKEVIQVSRDGFKPPYKR